MTPIIEKAQHDPHFFWCFTAVIDYLQSIELNENPGGIVIGGALMAGFIPKSVIKTEPNLS